MPVWPGVSAPFLFVETEMCALMCATQPIQFLGDGGGEKDRPKHHQVRKIHTNKTEKDIQIKQLKTYK